MARRRNKSYDTGIEKALLLFALLIYTPLAAFWGSLTNELKWIFGILSVSAVIVAVAMFFVYKAYRKRKRQTAWRMALKTWNQNSKNGTAPQFNTASDLSPMALEKLALQVYKRMGCSASLTETSGDHGVDVRLVNPNGQIELVQCKQWNRPVGEPEVRDLMGALVHEKGVKGYIWAPGGFSTAAKQWAKNKPILLMDNVAIGKLVESVYSN